MGCKDLNVICNMKREDLIPDLITDPIDRCIREKGTCIIKDLSKYTIQFHRIK